MDDVVNEAPGAAAPAAGGTVCAACGERAGDGARFCESCGAPLAAAAPAAEVTPTAAEVAPEVVAAEVAAEPAVGPSTADAPGTGPVPHPDACPACGGEVATDGYCTQCGARAPVERDHREEQPAPHVAGVSDVGVRRRRNEDALALGVVGDVSVLVVCDGVSSAPDSDVASQAAATTARDVLVAGAADVGADDAAGWSRLLVASGHRADAAAHAAVDDATARQDPPSCTFAAAVAGPTLLVAGWLGDSRVYWLPDAGTPEQLTEDDSVAAELMAGGMSRAAAERSPDAHAITRWLGADAGETTARTVATRPSGPGWVLACSDGLWNYASAPEVVADLLREAVRRVGTDPLALSRDLVAWANARGGHDNVTAALARVTGPTAGDADAHEADAGTAPTARRRPPGNLREQPVAPAP
ncbi:PP2C family protein-serine/threonine phosphatase [Cellulomonas wangsupingiae]|uniref:Serine/threonine-protein phosphatase n=1 Tax=Cellulomonas wangsupingiae TaxID=2968085 RepID=A0ABY5K6I0_9CELL|nr:PP2C family serine/threonine-protein phosphatase [Cellulomonas wangsupingiae]MCC2336462.1 serine/threonine-protein phosphatase [Cellulomonas wangsupingiae]MCM0640848.1 serine/threonine-protein phosphatase [Cellulomonas wangsupingiae]UUI64660.1 serine/threonine-protein phosphatase [Cellulomonas wangsupingiae]